MDCLRSEQLVDIVRREQINFIGSAITPWHAHGIDCAIHYLQDNGVQVNGIILLKPAVKQGKVCHILTEKNFVNKCCRMYKVPAVYDTSLKHVISSLVFGYKATKWYNNQTGKKCDKTIYIASPWHLDYNTFVLLYKSLGSSYSFRLMLVEEGLSSYFPAVDTKRHIWNTLSVNKHGVALILSFLLSVMNVFVRKRFESNTMWANLNLLIGSPNKLEANSIAVKYYRQVLTEYANSSQKGFQRLNLSNGIIICTMAYLHAEIQDESDVKTLELVVNELKRRGYVVYLKPHPRDEDYKNRYVSLGCDFIDSSCTVETLFVFYPGIRGIVSFSSTSLVTAKLLFDIKSVSVLNLVEKEKYGSYIREEMDSFTYCFSSIVEMPNSVKKLGEYFH